MKLRGAGPNLIVFLSCLLAFVGIWTGHITLPSLLTGMLSLFATATGAVLAFRFQELRESRAEAERNRVAMAKAFFVLARQFSACCDLEKYLPQGLNPITRAFATRPLATADYDDLKQNFDELAFLLDKNVNELFYLSTIDKTFHQMVATVKR